MSKSSKGQIVPAELTEEDKKKLLLIIENLEKEPLSYEFLNPVDTVGLGLTDYFDYIKHPMDLETLRSNIFNHKYVMVQEALNDLQQIWTNCKIYNMEGSDIYRMAETLEKQSRKFVEKYYKINKPPVFNSK